MGLLDWLGIRRKDASPAASPGIGEAEFLTRARSAGMDWTRSVDELQACYGVEPCETSQAVYLPTTAAFTPFPIRFHVRVPSLCDHCPPSTYTADVDLHGDAMRNFEALRTPLAALLGAGSDDTMAVNVVERRWDVGVFRVRLVAWPRSRDPRNDRESAFLTISSSIPHAPPDESLRAVVDLPPGDRLDSRPLAPPPANQAALPPWDWPLVRTNFAARLNPPGVFDAIGDAWPLIWRDRQRGRIGISGAKVSLVFERERATELQEHLLSPGRGQGSGYRHLDIGLRGPRSFLYQTTLAQTPWRFEIGELSRALAEFWELPINRFHGMDD